MRIGIDARVMLPKGQGSGIGRYIIEMVEALAKLPGSARHEFILYPAKATAELELPANWRYCRRSNTERGIGRALAYPLIALRDRLDLFYTADYLGPILPMPCKSVVTVHDLIPIVYPEVVTRKHHLVGRYLLPRSIRLADRVVAVSNATRADILRYAPVEPTKIAVIYEGKNPEFYPRPADAAVLERYGIGAQPYLLFVGTLEPKKNLKNVVRAFAGLPDTVRGETRLVLGGKIGWDSAELMQLIDELNIRNRILLPGFIAEDDLPVLLSSATAFCFPSLYEGFGLPVLEALACGAPVITSRTSSLPEVAGEAALLVDPQDSAAIGSAMQRLLTDERLGAELKTRAVAQAAKFSWDAMAEQLLNIFESA